MNELDVQRLAAWAPFARKTWMGLGGGEGNLVKEIFGLTASAVCVMPPWGVGGVLVSLKKKMNVIEALISVSSHPIYTVHAQNI